MYLNIFWLKKHFSGLAMQNQNVGRLTRKQFKTSKLKQLQAKLSQPSVLYFKLQAKNV